MAFAYNIWLNHGEAADRVQMPRRTQALVPALHQPLSEVRIISSHTRSTYWPPPVRSSRRDASPKGGWYSPHGNKMSLVYGSIRHPGITEPDAWGHVRTTDRYSDSWVDRRKAQAGYLTAVSTSKPIGRINDGPDEERGESYQAIARSDENCPRSCKAILHTTNAKYVFRSV